MDDSPVPNSNYALQLALQTLKDRCVQLQKRVSTLQEENIGLKTTLPGHPVQEPPSSLEVKISRLTEERNQLKNTISMVATENKQLWSSLSQLASESKNSKIRRNSDDKQHMPLIRSRTFTQEAPHTKHLKKVLSESENGEKIDVISLELEDISLKLDHSSLEDSLGDSLGFNYLEDEAIDDSLGDCIEQHLVDMKNVKLLLQQHSNSLKSSVKNLKSYKSQLERNEEEVKKRKLERSATKTVQVNIEDEERQAAKKIEETNWVPENSVKVEFDRAGERICPLCCQKFQSDGDFEEFSAHVQQHFMDTSLLQL